MAFGSKILVHFIVVAAEIGVGVVQLKIIIFVSTSCSQVIGVLLSIVVAALSGEHGLIVGQGRG